MKPLSKTVFVPMAVLLLTAALVFNACGPDNNNGNNENRERRVVVETLETELRSFDEQIRITGTVEAIDDAIISAEVSGRVQSIADRGTRLKMGQELVSLDDRIVRSSLEIARANYELAEDALQRQEPLLRDSIISTLQYNEIRTQRDRARAQLEQAEKQLNDSRISAPFEGRVEDRMVSAGELVNPGIPVLRLVNLDKVRINAGVPERYINEIGEGSAVRVSLASYGGGVLEGEVHYAGSLIIPETRTFPVEVVMDNSDGLLKPEMVVNLAITRKVWEDVLLVPRTALVRDEDGFQLFVVNGGEGERRMAEARRVVAGAASGPLIVIEEGLQHGDEVIVTGQTNVSDGDLIRIHERRTYDRYQ
ncbi:MAG: efflux RND transporter periplasmic adaptor subunit [Cyclonatronaceae bacterium]